MAFFLAGTLEDLTAGTKARRTPALSEYRGVVELPDEPEVTEAAFGVFFLVGFEAAFLASCASVGVCGLLTGGAILAN